MDFKKLGLSEVITILKSNKIKELLGAEENENFEFKEKPYNLIGGDKNKDQVKLEVVKDISALANSGGGILCFGLKRDKPDGQFKDYAKEIVPVKKEDINVEGWMQYVANMLVPLLPSSSVDCGYAGEKDELFWMNIPNVRELGKYPLIVFKDQWQPADNVYVRGNVIGIYYRDGGQVRNINPEQIQVYIAQGLENDTLSPMATDRYAKYMDTLLLRVDSLGSQVDSLQKDLNKNGQKKTNQSGNDKKTVDYAATRMGGEDGFFYIDAMPANEVYLENFWEESGRESIYEMLRKPPELRKFGWDLNTADSEYPYVQGNSWESTNGDRKLIRVTRYGEIFAAGSIDGFFDWKNEEEQEIDGKKTKLVNMFALTEFIDIFFHFLQIFKMVRNLNTDYIIKAGFVLPQGKNIRLHSPSLSGRFGIGTSNQPSLLMWSVKIKGQDHRHPAYMAADLAIEINASFGWVKNPPYFTNGKDGQMIDENQYVKAKG